MDNSLPFLYVEDDARSRRVMQMIAISAQLTSLVTFEDSNNFLARAEALEPRPDVIFLDIHMKPINGFEMLPMIRQSKRLEGVPVVAMTASVMNEEVEQLRMAGFDGCLAKPIDMDTFPDTLNRILGREHVWQIIG